MTTDALIEREPEKAEAAVRALVRAQKTLREDPERATAIGERLFPAMEATLIARIIERDLRFYDATISEAAVDGMNDFARRRGLLNSSSVRYDEVVATQFAHLWTA